MYNTLLFSLASDNLWLNAVLIIAGIAVVIWGADRMTEGATRIAERLKVPQVVIGLTIVAFGTSMPEFCVSLVSALKNTADLAIGNVIGSNIFNTLLIVGASALVAPITILKKTVRRDMAFSFIASLALMLMIVLTGEISRLSAALLFAGLIIFMYTMIRDARKEKTETSAIPSEERVKEHPMLVSVGLVILGLVCLVAGSNVFVDNATAVAQSLGVSEAVIGLTIVAGGTSMPELATSVVAARKGQSGIAIGNVLGSNVMNILFILGVTGLISPMQVNGITIVDLITLILSMLVLWLFSATKLTVERWEGGILLALFTGYMAWLFMNI